MGLIQALQFVGNDMQEGVKRGRYLNTLDCLAEDGGVTRIGEELHEHFEQRRREKLSACIERRNALLTARRIIAAADLDAFAGRCAVSCPTRGGAVFNCLVALLGTGAAGSGGDGNGAEVPHICEKVWT